MGMVQAKYYYINRKKRKGGIDTVFFGMVAWDNIKSIIKGTSNMFKICHTKQGSQFYGVG